MNPGKILNTGKGVRGLWCLMALTKIFQLCHGGTPECMRT